MSIMIFFQNTEKFALNKNQVQYMFTYRYFSLSHPRSAAMQVTYREAYQLHK